MRFYYRFVTSPPRHISKAQRERILRRAERLRSWCESARRRRPAFAAVPAREQRFARVAGRLERFVAGVERDASTMPLVEQAMRRHIGGVTSYGEWIEELRWAGLPARHGHTRLNQAQAAERRKNSLTIYPRICDR